MMGMNGRLYTSTERNLSQKEDQVSKNKPVRYSFTDIARKPNDRVVPIAITPIANGNDAIYGKILTGILSKANNVNRPSTRQVSHNAEMITIPLPLK